ncbi:hypothetical protein [Kitasatospora kifunensis]|uniref:Uncharacterized protein n=1 Tax=Kitasatospora kifunensis TaxID=58351 RepID=A0A7W7R1N2_KITKI|nr:hypothetical protein [Kitasatospora kifunensis]MBB4923770.1 hypothetical protein [Kitasatospora kifunensis]
MASEPRYALKATYDVKEAWSRLLLDEFGPGGWIAETAPDFNREHLLWALSLLRHVNGRTGEVFIGDKALAQGLGYTGNSHPGTSARRTLKRLGLLHPTGRGKGRAEVVRLSAPACLVNSEKYETLRESVIGDLESPLIPAPAGTKKEVESDKDEGRSLESKAPSSKKGEERLKDHVRDPFCDCGCFP